MDGLLISLGLLGFVGGVIAVIALFAQRDANKEKEKAAEEKSGVEKGGAGPSKVDIDHGGHNGRPGGNGKPQGT